MDFSTAIRHVESETLAPVYVLVGTETMLQQLFLDAMVKRLSGSSQRESVVRFRYEDEGPDNALFQCRSFSFFDFQAVVVLENCTALVANGKTKFDNTILEEYLENPVPGKFLVITVDADKLDERKKIVKIAKKHKVVACSKPKDDAALQIIRVIAKQDGIEIAKDALDTLWRRSPSIASCRTDLQKLWTYANHHLITKSDVEELVPPQLEDNVFNWLNSVVKGDIGRSFRVLSEVKHAGYDSFALLAMIARQLRMMWYAKVFGSKGYTEQQIATRVSAHPYAVKVAMEQCSVFTTGRLEQLILTVADAEFDVKSGRRDMEQALSYLVAACAVTTEIKAGEE
jgi:DNA polymerase III subunit delta